jgi:hypothetical protein
MSPRRPNCLICDSARHVTVKCRSNKSAAVYNQVRELFKTERPDFHSYNMKELKQIAILTPYEDSISMYKIKNGFIHKRFKYNPIPITLPKKYLIERLIERWISLNRIITNFTTKPQSGYECPVCYEEFTEYTWSFLLSKWIRHLIQPAVVTPCGHTFCKSCWGHLPTSRFYFQEERTHLYSDGYAIGRSCPLCRHKVMDKKVKHYDTGMNREKMG